MIQEALEQHNKDSKLPQILFDHCCLASDEKCATYVKKTEVNNNIILYTSSYKCPFGMGHGNLGPMVNMSSIKEFVENNVNSQMIFDAFMKLNAKSINLMIHKIDRIGSDFDGWTIHAEHFGSWKSVDGFRIVLSRNGPKKSYCVVC